MPEPRRRFAVGVAAHLCRLSKGAAATNGLLLAAHTHQFDQLVARFSVSEQIQNAAAFF